MHTTNSRTFTFDMCKLCVCVCAISIGFLRTMFCSWSNLFQSELVIVVFFCIFSVSRAHEIEHFQLNISLKGITACITDVALKYGISATECNSIVML